MSLVSKPQARALGLGAASCFVGLLFASQSAMAAEETVEQSLLSPSESAEPIESDSLGDLAEHIPTPAVWMGEDAETCAWPTTVMVTGGGGQCTGTLIHPQVVSYAAHCGDQGKQIIFGESVRAARTVTPEFCRVNPNWRGGSGQDFAVCKLPYPIDLPITPPITGNCEVGILTPGAEIVVAGFGSNTGIDATARGSGTKRWAITRLHSANYGANIASLGGNPNPSVLQGDSGGPAFIRYPDGSWHTFGIASTIQGEGGPATHCLIYGAIPWFEEQTGVDLTPCFDDEGEWDPGPYCQNFFAAEPGVGSGVWGREWCGGSDTVEFPDYCGPAFGADDSGGPEVTITSPEHATHSDESTSVTIEIEASDDTGVKQVYLAINGEVQGAPDTAEPFEFSDVTFPEGRWSITAIAEDWVGNEVESEPVVLTFGEQHRGSANDDAGEDETSGTGEEDESSSRSDDDDGGTSSERNGDGGNSDDGAGAADGGDGGGCTLSSPAGGRGTLLWSSMILLTGFVVRRRKHLLS